MYTLLTGATGALGSEILKRLATQGERVLCLVRSRGTETPDARIRHILGRTTENVKVVEGDICEPFCGVSDDNCSAYRGKISRVLHSAASISFWDRAEAEAVNIGGIQNVLSLAELFEVTDFHHVSTAYVCGGAGVFRECERLSFVTHPPRNVYEETKQGGEKMVRLWASLRHGRRFSMYRPSILIGREDGTTPTFDAYYGYFKPLYAIAEALRVKRQKKEALPPDVYVDKAGVVDVPLVLYAAPEATLNFVPVNWVADMIVKLLRVSARDKAYHLVNPSPPLVRWVITASLNALKIRVGDGARIVIAESGEEKARALAAQSPVVARLQRQLARVLDQYFAYTSQGPVFTAHNAECALGAPPPKFRRIDEQFIKILLDYAIAEQWGASRKKEDDLSAS